MIGRDCGACGWSQREGLQLPGWCPRCRGRCVADLADLPGLYRDLGEKLTPGSGAGGDAKVRSGKRPAAPLPLTLDAANQRGPATAGPLKGPDQVGALSIATAVSATRLAVRTFLDLPDERAGDRARLGTAHLIRTDVDWLLGQLDRYVEGIPPAGVAALCRVVGDVRWRAWRACGYNAHKIRLGPCPHEVDQGQHCGHELWIDPVLDDSVTCRDCHTRWDRRYFLWLRRIGLEEGAVGLSDHLPHDATQLGVGHLRERQQ